MTQICKTTARHREASQSIRARKAAVRSPQPGAVDEALSAVLASRLRELASTADARAVLDSVFVLALDHLVTRGYSREASMSSLRARLTKKRGYKSPV
ncbi:hypothetical protein [Rhizobium ruizarguesonis]|uniref:hypothetical protein n=1 Tax=Rhizobium ruizarguesonis TaxID=2081791 RepID=UPI00102FF36A|nr:hypothetical protein [Rhizobium ruizarguesonis]TBD19868.1 hypothetical protein ELH23_02400 [Rhizobium ruizarguesonis]